MGIQYKKWRREMALMMDDEQRCLSFVGATEPRAFRVPVSRS